MVVRKERGKFVVRSKSGRLLGKHDTRAAALRQLRAVEASKSSRSNKKKG